MKRALVFSGTLFLLVILVLPLSVGARVVGPRAAGGTTAAAPQPQPPTPPFQRVITGTDGAIEKIHPNLREAAQAGGDEWVPVNVFLTSGASPDGITHLFDHPIVRTFLGLTSVVGKVRAEHLIKLAASDAVDVVLDPQPYTPPPRTLDPDMIQRLARAQQNIRARLEDRPIPRAPRPDNDTGIEGWWDITKGHRSSYAWKNGYTGDGVMVAVIDSGVDFSHPDLQGTWAVYPVTSTTIPEEYLEAYGGWPIAFDSRSMDAYAHYGGPAPDTWYADTSYTVQVHRLYWPLVQKGFEASLNAANAAPQNGGTLRAAISFDGKTYFVPGTSKSGAYHIGYHPDTALEAWWYGEPVAVLVVDENTAGVYDTVYVDLDDDYDFTNEKPATRDDPISWMDFDLDGYADLSGGMIYFIADGLNHPPGFDWLYGVPFAPPGPGDMVAFMLNDPLLAGGDHGQLCASAVVGQGLIDGDAPPWKPAGVGGMVQGGGLNTKVVAMGNYYQGGNETDFYAMVALGYDGIPDSGDEPLIASMSYGYSGTDNDVWDETSRFLTYVNVFYAPHTSFMGSTGNGAPGYGTVNSPSPVTGVSVGASTQYDSCGVFDPIETALQMLWGDVQSWSDSGPGADGSVGVSVLANGAWGAGDMALNEWGDGWTAWYSWGGTSRSTPVAAGNMALIYDAFFQAHGEYPEFQEARSLMMAGANDAFYDPARQGAGVLNAERSTWVAGGDYGIYAFPDTWTFGDYRGDNFLSFANIMEPDEKSGVEFDLVNDSDNPITVILEDAHFVLMGKEEWSFVARNSIEQVNFSKPDYLFPATRWVEPGGPYYGADFMAANLVFPYNKFSLSNPETGPLNWNSRWRVLIYDWTDLDLDGDLWTDTNGNQAVQWDEIDAGEYNRYGYGYSAGTTMMQSAGDPSHRYHDGIYVGVQHRTVSKLIPTTTLGLQVSFYDRVDWPWLETDAVTLTVPAHDEATFDATMSVPDDTPYGFYQGEILVYDPGYGMYPAHTLVIPVAVNVAASGTSFQFGNVDQDFPYDNGSVAGYFDWSWRAESGDWRFFFTDVPEDHLPAGTNLLVHTVWPTVTYPTDLDTLIFGPTLDGFSADYPGLFGPYMLEKVGGSEKTLQDAGKWLFKTATGTTEEWASGVVTNGLHLVALHNVLYNPGNGLLQEVPFSATVGTLSVVPNPVEVWRDLLLANKGAVTLSGVLMTATSSLALPGLGLVGSAYGLSQPTEWDDEPISPGPTSCDWSYVFTPTNAGYIEITTASPDITDIDLFLQRKVGATWLSVASSGGPTAAEYVKVILPVDGTYRVCVDDYTGIAGHFDMLLTMPAGTDLSITGLPSGAVTPGVPVNFNLNYVDKADGDWYGVLFVGPEAAPTAIMIPVTIHFVAP